MSAIEAHLVYALAWVSFGAGHSLLAAQWAKDKLTPALGRWYRLSYNVFAAIHIASVWLIGAWAMKAVSSFTLPQSIQSGMDVLYFVGIAIFLLALRGYDLGLLTGLSQIRDHRPARDEPEIEPLHTGGLHAYVRHPIYTGAYLLLWGHAQDDLGLATAIWGSVYLAVGTMFEEQHLVSLYGDAYRKYRSKVPAILPWRGKVL